MGNKASDIRAQLPTNKDLVLSCIGNLGPHRRLGEEGETLKIRIARKIGEGGFSSVYCARETKRSVHQRLLRRQKQQQQRIAASDTGNIDGVNNDNKDGDDSDDRCNGSVTAATYAVKHMVCKEDEWVVRCEEEIKMHRLCVHPNVLPLLAWANIDAGRGVRHYLLMLPLCSAGSLQDLIDDRPAGCETSAFSLAGAMSFLGDVSEGLMAIHQAGFAHRDLKPANVLLLETTAADPADRSPVEENNAGGGGVLRARLPRMHWARRSKRRGSNKQNTRITVQVMDLGSCARVPLRVSTVQEAAMLSDTAATHSTPTYRAPELFDCPCPTIVDEKTDVWSLGCMVYCMAFGRSPFEFGPGGSFERLAVMNGNVSFEGHHGLENVRWRSEAKGAEARGRGGGGEEKCRTSKGRQSPAAGAKVVETPGFVELVRGMLQVDPADRLSLKEVMHRAMWRVGDSGDDMMDGLKTVEGDSDIASGIGHLEGGERPSYPADVAADMAPRDSWADLDGSPEHDGKDAQSEFDVDWGAVEEVAGPVVAQSTDRKNQKKKKKKKKKRKKAAATTAGTEDLVASRAQAESEQ